MKAQWDQKVMRLTRRTTQKPDAEGVATLLTALSRRCDRNFRFVFPGNRRECFLAYKEPRGNGNFQKELVALAEAANLHLEADEFQLPVIPETTVVRQLAEPSLDANVPATIQALVGATRTVFDSRGGQILRILVEWNDELTQIATGFRESRPIKNGRCVFIPGHQLRDLMGGGISFADLALGFYLDQFEPEISPVAVQVGTSESGSLVFVDAGAGHILILGPANSTVGRAIGNQLALKAAQASQIVVVIQPQTGEDLGVFRSPRIVSTRQDDRSIAEWQRQVLVGPGLTVVQGHPGGDALERIKSILEGLWNSAQMECHRDGWPGMLVMINDFIPFASEPKETPGRTLPAYRHELYELLAQMAGSFNAIRLVLLGRPSVVFGVEHLRAVIGSFGGIVRLRTVAEGYPPGEGYSHDRYVDQEFREWLHAEGAHDRCLVLGPEGWTRTKLELVEPEVEVAMEPEIRVLRPEEVGQPHRWGTRERREPTGPVVPPWAPATSVTTEGELKRLLKAKGFLPILPKERGALEELKAKEAKAQAAIGAEAETEEEEAPTCQTPLSNKQVRTLKKILDLVDALVAKGFDPQGLRRLVRSGVPRERFEAFLAGNISQEELEVPAAEAQEELIDRVRNLREDSEGLAQVLPGVLI